MCTEHPYAEYSQLGQGHDSRQATNDGNAEAKPDIPATPSVQATRHPRALPSHAHMAHRTVPALSTYSSTSTGLPQAPRSDAYVGASTIACTVRGACRSYSQYQGRHSIADGGVLLLPNTHSEESQIKNIRRRGAKRATVGGCTHSTYQLCHHQSVGGDKYLQHDSRAMPSPRESHARHWRQACDFS